MAGAAERLKRTSPAGPEQGVLLPLTRSLQAASGPWLFTVAALVIISLIAAPSLSRAVVADFRGIVIYAFALSLVASAPAVMIVTRVLSDAIYLGSRTRAQPVLLTGAAVAGALSALLALFVGGALFHMLPAPLAALVQAAGLTGIMWVGVAAANATRDYDLLGRTFLAGLIVATVSCLTAALALHGTAAQMALAFNAGLGLIPFALLAYEQRLHGTRSFRLAEAVAELRTAAWTYRVIAAGGLLAAAAVWSDKWMMWAGPASLSLGSGLVHAPLYDSAAFLATLTIIPGLTRFVIAVDTRYIAAYRGYYEAIKTHANLEEIERRAAGLGRMTKDLLDDVLILQAGICAIVVLCAPQIVSAINLQFAQVPILRLCTLAVLFQLLFVASCSLLIFFDRHRAFLALQALFFTLNAAGTAVTLAIGPPSYGAGLLVASVISGIAAYAAIANTLRNIDYLTFVDGAVRMHERERAAATSAEIRWPRSSAAPDRV